MKYFLAFTFLVISTITVNAQDTTTVKSNSNEPIMDDIPFEEPQYPGGPAAMGEFIFKTVVYPDSSRINKEQGTVYVQMVINTDGTISDVVVIKGVSPLLDAEAVRVVQLMPLWRPGTENGKTVRVRYYIPIHFQLK